jgi:TetR/AcrR family transcriptional regulator, transcriptional repressor for nem operon
MAGRKKEFDPDAALAAAVETFWAGGYEAVGMERLLEQMGVGRQSAYDTFGGKRDIFVKALEAYVAKVNAALTGLLLGDGPPLGRLKEFLRWLGDLTGGGSERGCLITNTIVEVAPHDAEVRRIVSTAMEQLEGLIARVLKEAMAAGEIEPRRDAKRLARMVVVTFEGSLVLAKTDRASVVRDALAVVEDVVIGNKR